MLTVSASAVSFAGSTITYDFSTDVAQAYSNGWITPPLNNWHNLGVFVIWGGDVNQDGIVDSSDMNPVDNASTAITFGYVPEDCDGSGLVDSGDMNIVDNNSTKIVMSQTP